jgi:hypothetical protein
MKERYYIVQISNQYIVLTEAQYELYLIYGKI